MFQVFICSEYKGELPCTFPGNGSCTTIAALDVLRKKNLVIYVVIEFYASSAFQCA